MNYSKGISWFDDCRIPFVDDGENTKRKVSGHQKVYGSGEEIHYKLNLNNQSDRDNGRFPANLLCSDDVLNDGSISKSKKVKSPLLNITGGSYGKAKGNTDKITERGIDDKGSNSRYYDIDLWFNNLLENNIY